MPKPDFYVMGSTMKGVSLNDPEWQSIFNLHGHEAVVMPKGGVRSIRREKMAGRPDKKSVRIGIGHGAPGTIAAQAPEPTVSIIVVQEEVGLSAVPEDHQAICSNA